MNEEDRLLELKDKAKEVHLRLPLPSWKYGLNIRLKFDLDLDNIKDIDVAPLKLFASSEVVVDNLHSEIFSTLDANDKFSNFHVANAARFLVIEIPEGKTGNSKLVTDSVKNTFDTIMIIAKPNSRLDFIYNNKNQNQLSSTYIEILAAENSVVNFISIENSKNYNIITRKAAVGKNASVNWLETIPGSAFVKADTKTFLVEEGAATRHYSIFKGSQENQADIVAKAVHEVAGTKSELLAKGLLNDKAKAVYQGDITMLKQAKGSIGSQKSEVLLLSKDAEADAVPKLVVDNYDVTASHSSSVGRLDADKLFYLTSRGLSEEEAKDIMIEGFFDPLIMKIPEKMQDEIRVVMR